MIQSKKTVWTMLALFGISSMILISACKKKDDDAPTPTPNADITGVYDGNITWQSTVDGMTDNGTDPTTITATGSGTSFSLSDGFATMPVIVSGNSFSGTSLNANGQTLTGTLNGSLSGNNLSFNYSWTNANGTTSGTFTGTRPDPTPNVGGKGPLTANGVSYPFVNCECRANNLVIYAAYEVDAAFGDPLKADVKGVVLHFPTTSAPAAGTYSIVTYASVDAKQEFSGNVVVASYIDDSSVEATSGSVTVTTVGGVPNFSFSNVSFGSTTASASAYPCTY